MNVTIEASDAPVIWKEMPIFNLLFWDTSQSN